MFPSRGKAYLKLGILIKDPWLHNIYRCYIESYLRTKLYNIKVGDISSGEARITFSVVHLERRIR